MVAPRGTFVVAPGGGMNGCSRGMCMVAPGRHAWLLQRGMHGCSREACMVAPGGVHGCSRGEWLLPGGAWVGYDEIRRYDQ